MVARVAGFGVVVACLVVGTLAVVDGSRDEEKATNQASRSRLLPGKGPSEEVGNESSTGERTPKADAHRTVLVVERPRFQPAVSRDALLTAMGGVARFTDGQRPGEEAAEVWTPSDQQELSVRFFGDCGDITGFCVTGPHDIRDTPRKYSDFVRLARDAVHHLTRSTDLSDQFLISVAAFSGKADVDRSIDRVRFVLTQKNGPVEFHVLPPAAVRIPEHEVVDRGTGSEMERLPELEPAELSGIRNGVGAVTIGGRTEESRELRLRLKHERDEKARRRKETRRQIAEASYRLRLQQQLNAAMIAGLSRLPNQTTSPQTTWTGWTEINRGRWGYATVVSTGDTEWMWVVDRKRGLVAGFPHQRPVRGGTPQPRNLYPPGSAYLGRIDNLGNVWFSRR